MFNLSNLKEWIVKNEIFSKKLPNKKHHTLLNNLKINKTTSIFLSQGFLDLNFNFKRKKKLYNSRLTKQNLKLHYSPKENLDTTFILKNRLQDSLSDKMIRKQSEIFRKYQETNYN